MLRSRMIGIGFASVLATLLAGCVPQVDFDPVAIRLSSPGTPEILYTSCTPIAVEVVEVVAVENNWNDNTPRVWKIEFPSGSRMRSFVVGSTPEGAVERVHWQTPEGSKGLAARMVLEGNIGVYQDFEMRELKVDEVVFHNRSISADEFTRASACG